MKEQLSVLALVIFFVIAGYSCNSADVEEIDRTLLTQPNMDEVNQPAPESFQVEFETSKGIFVIEAHRSWSPHGVDRFYYLIKSGFYHDMGLYRVVANFMVQFGVHGDPEISSIWSALTFSDDSVKQQNLRGYLSYAKASMPNSRTTQLFINFRDNSSLDEHGFSPIGKVIQGMEVVDQLFSGYGDLQAFGGNAPDPGRIQREGNSFLKSNYPELDYIIKTKIK